MEIEEIDWSKATFWRCLKIIEKSKNHPWLDISYVIENAQTLAYGGKIDEKEEKRIAWLESLLDM